MQRAWLTLLMAGAAAAMLAAAAAAMPAAAAGEFPYCIRGCDFGGGGAGVGDCRFSSLAQCQATASGGDATCAANPYFNARADMKTDRSRQSRKGL